MPTENRSSNTEQMVSLPLDLVELALAHLPSDSAAGFELRELLAQPAAQHQGDPVMRLEAEKLLGGHGEYAIDFVKPGWLNECREKGGTFLLYPHPPTSDGFSAGDMADQGAKAFAARDREVELLRAQLADRDALLRTVRETLQREYWDQYAGLDETRDLIDSALSAGAELSAPAVSIPDGYCLMPKRLTAENGAKALLLGEFKLEVTRDCPECLELDEPVEGCEICDGEGEYAQRHTIPWDKIKFIYSEAVKSLAIQPGAAVERQA